MTSVLKSQQWRKRSQTTRRRLLIIGSSIGVSLVAGCTEETETGGSDDHQNGNVNPNSDTNQSDRTDDPEHSQSNGSNPTETDQAMTVERTSFEVVSRNSGAGKQNVVIDTNEETVHIEGIITGRTSCYTADLKDVIIEDGDLHIHVESYDASDEDELCTEALVDIEYRAEIILSDVPATVTVSHNGDKIERE